MSHTDGRYQQDLGFTDGRLFAGPQDILGIGTTTITRNAAGDISWNQGATLTCQYAINLTSIILRRTGFGEDLQQQFGGSGISASAQVQNYRPDQIGAMNTGQQLQPRTANKLKGVKLTSFDVNYSITGAALLAHTCRVDQTLFANNVAPAITALLASGANGLATATQANPYLTTVALAAGQQIYRVTADQEIWIEFSVQTQGAGAYRMYGVDLVVEFNFN